MGESSEERLMNFLEWKDEVDERLTVAGVADEQAKVRVALMWRGKEIKEYATQRAGMRLKKVGNNEAHKWEDAMKLIQTKMEAGLNQAFAMSKFRQC